MKAPDILREYSFSGNRHCQKQRIKTGIIETFSYIATRCNQNPFFRLTNKKLVFSEYDLEYVLAKAAGGEGGYQNIGIQQDPHKYRRDRCV